MSHSNEQAGLIWNIADLLRGGWKQHEYQDVILPLVVLKRLDSVIAPTKQSVLEAYNQYHGKVDIDPILKRQSGVGFYNISPFDFDKLLEEPRSVARNFRKYVDGFSDNVKEIFDKFNYGQQLDRLEGGNLLYKILKEFQKVNLHPTHVDNHEMGSIFEELIRKFSEQSNETAGEHYTPREVIKTMVEILFSPDRQRLQKDHIIRKIYDCACGTGGMLTVSKDHIVDSGHPINSNAMVYLYGQELNAVTYAICKADMLIKGEDPEKIKGGEKDHSKASTLSNDQFYGEKFDYCLTNPPFGVDWKKDKEYVEREAAKGYAGRFGAGTPRISDGQLLFLQHLLSKMQLPESGGSRIAIVMNGSPLFTGDAGSGESEIRRWILERDWLEAIVALPDQMFYNTGISTYLWFLSNRKEANRKGKVQLIDARTYFHKMKKSLGNKRNFIADSDREAIVTLYEECLENNESKIFNTTDFAYRQIRIERPLRLKFQITKERIERLKENKAIIKSGIDVNRLFEKIGGKEYMNKGEFETDLDKQVRDVTLKLSATARQAILRACSERDDRAEIVLDKDGAPEPDTELRDHERVPWGVDVHEYFEKEVAPYVSDAWLDETVRDEKDGEIGKVGYEIPLTRYFYTYKPPRDLDEIQEEIKSVEEDLADLIKQLS